jgi:pyruvate,orthophosphate dikinase
VGATGRGYTVTFDEADPAAVDVLGGKGAGLARMTQGGLRVPPGFVISTAACRAYLTEEAVPPAVFDEVFGRLTELESRTGKVFGAGPEPLLLSVRSGAPVSMPGMMDTILDLGLGRDAMVALARACGDTRFVATVLLRFHRMYAQTVLEALESPPALDDLVAEVAPDAEPGEVYDRLWSACQEAVRADVGEGVPDDPAEQLVAAIEAVFGSWKTPRARTYRDFHRIPHELGTAVVVQSMVFGNLSTDSGSGVAFTRDPVSGDAALFGEFLAGSQGEDVVSGTRTPQSIADASRGMPEVFAELREKAAELEREQADVLDIEFTVERSVLYFLQVRSAKRTAEAATRIAAEFLRERVVAPNRALRAVTAEQVRHVQRPGFDADELDAARGDGRVLATGIGAAPGQVAGALALDPDRAAAAAAEGRPVILARAVTSPGDLHGMIAAEGIVTATGGSTSHAAVVARALGKTCVVGAAALRIDDTGRTLSADGGQVAEGEEVSLDGTTGELFVGGFARSAPAETNADLQEVLGLARHAAGCAVFSRVTVPDQIPPARQAGAAGLVTAVDDVLAASGHLGELVATLLAQRDVRTIDLQHIEDTVAHEFTPLLAAAGGLEVGVRAIDFLADEARELLQQTELLTHYPELSVPLGLPQLLEAQLAGLARAAGEAGAGARVHLAVRHVSDPAEAEALRECRSRVAERMPVSPVGVGAYVTSPRGAFHSGGVAAGSEIMWVEVRVLQAAVFGIPARALLTQQPVDDYVRRGLFSTDPRWQIDPAVDTLLRGMAADVRAVGGCRLGMRLSGAVSEDVAAALYRHGLRWFAVDADETRPVTLALGKAALEANATS